MSRRSTGWISKQRREAIYTRDKHTCLWCGRQLERAELTLDHFVPVAEGGSDRTCNLFTACNKHNSSRQNMSVYHFAIKMSEPLTSPTGLQAMVMRILRAVATQLPKGCK